MELYILNKAYYKKNSPTATLHSSTVLVTTNRDRVVSQLNHEHNKMLQYFSDILEEPENLISQNNMQMHPKAPTGYSYEGRTVIAFLTISVISTNSIPDEEPLKPRDIVKFKEDAEAYFASHRSEYRHFVGAKTALIRDVKDTTAVVEILQSSSTEYLSRIYEIPLDYLTKVTV